MQKPKINRLLLYADFALLFGIPALLFSKAIGLPGEGALAMLGAVCAFVYWRLYVIFGVNNESKNTKR